MFNRSTNLGIHFVEDVSVFLEEAAGVLAALTDAFARSSCTTLPTSQRYCWRPPRSSHISLAADAFAIEDVELGFAEGSSDLVLDDLDLCAIAGHGVAFFDIGDASDVDADRGVELEGAAAGGGFQGCRT